MITTEGGHPLDLELFDFATHLQSCQPCRQRFARMLYPLRVTDEPPRAR